MTSNRDTSGLVRDVYRDALKRDPEEWNDYLDRACAGRPDVRELPASTSLAIGPEHPEFSMLFVGVAAAALVAAFVIEPATARVAFGDTAGLA